MQNKKKERKKGIKRKSKFQPIQLRRTTKIQIRVGSAVQVESIYKLENKLLKIAILLKFPIPLHSH